MLITPSELWMSCTIGIRVKQNFMLRDTFYTMNSRAEMTDSRIMASISFIRESPIFNGHFPQHPVVPGVCMFAIIKELLEAQKGSSLHLVECRNMKFLNMIDPDQTPTVNVEVEIQTKEDGHLLVKARLFREDTVYFNMSGAIYQFKNGVNGSV